MIWAVRRHPSIRNYAARCRLISSWALHHKTNNTKIRVNMRNVKLHPYLLLGSSIRYLLDVREGMLINGPRTKRDELSLLAHLKRVESHLSYMGLNVTAQAFKGELGEHIKTFEKLSEGTIISKKQAQDVLERMKVVADVLRYEATNLQAYIIAEKRLPVNKLLTDISGLFGDGVFWVLPELCKYDFTQAGKCIAFEVPTAAAFHILRGTEGVLRSYFTALIPNDSVSSTPLLWGGIITDLRKMTSNPPTKELLDNLDNIRVSFRNPTQHPEKTYDLDEVQDLFNLCVDVVNRMAKDLFRRGIWQEIPF